MAVGEPLRLAARYDNPTSDTLAGVMGTMGGLFAPADLRRWPPVDTTDPDYRVDLAAMTAALPGSGPPIPARCDPSSHAPAVVGR